MRHTLCHPVLRLLTSRFQTVLTDLPADAAQLFNNASIYSFVVLQACTHHARNYIREVLGPVLADLVHKSHLSFEIDHRYVGTDEVERNLSHLCHVANHIIAALLISVDSLPMYARPAKKLSSLTFAAHFGGYIDSHRSASRTRTQKARRAFRAICSSRACCARRF